MTPAARLLDRLTSLGVTLHAAGGRLRFRAPKGVMTPHLAADIRTLEAELIQHLSASAAIPLVPEADSYELSHAQRRLWVLHALDPDTAAYNIPLVHLLEGPIDVNAIREALAWIAARHEALRTTIVSHEGSPRQRIAASSSLPLIVLNEPDEPAAHGEVRRIIAQPFDLDRGPLARVALVRLAPERHLFVVVLHHIIADGVTIAVLMRDFAAAYSAARAGRALAAPARAVQYRDCAAWQNVYLESADADAHREYWRRKLAAPVARIDLPTDFPRPATASGDGAEETFVMDRGTVEALRGLCRRQGATLFMGLVAAVKVLLHRYTGVEDVVIGTPAAGRDHADAESVAGVFINTLVLRDTVERRMTFEDVLAAVRRSSGEALDHARYPFDRLVQDLDTDRDPSRSPVFDVMVILQNQQTDRLALPGLAVSHMYAHTGTSKFDVTFNFHEADGAISVGIEYRTSLFCRARITRMGSHLISLIGDAAAHPSRGIHELALVGREERELVVSGWNQTSRPFALTRTVVDLFEDQVRQRPEAIAVGCGGETVTYGELSRWSARIAAGLHARGVRRGSIVGVKLDRSTQLLAALLGVLRTGAAYCPVDPAYPAERIEFQLRDVGAQLVLTEPSLTESGGPEIRPPYEEDRRPTSSDVAYVIHTSGSTGVPKGVIVTHRNLTNLLLSMAEAPGLEAHDVFLAVTSLSFDIAALELYLPLITGARLVIATSDETRDGARLLARLSACHATVMQGTPATWRMLVAVGWRGSPSFKALCGGELLADSLARELRERAGEVWNLYGPTETTVWSLLQRVDDPDRAAYPHAGVPIGKPIANTQTYLLDPAFAPVPRGYVGDLYLAGDGVAQGYLGRPDLTADRFVPDPFAGRGRRMYRTGDRAVSLEDGTIQFLGRDDHQVKVRGFRIELGEIEEALIRHPDVAEAVAVAAGDAGERAIVAYVVPRGSAAFDPVGLRTHLSRLLPPQTIPSLFMRLARLPLTPNGKVDRRSLPRPDRTLAVTAPPVPPRDDRERAIRGVWASVLDLDDIGVHDNFFELGGHSLRATRVTYLLQSALGVDVQLIDIFKAPTIAELAERLRGRRASDAGAITSASATVAAPRDDSGSIAPMTPEEAQLLGDL